MTERFGEAELREAFLAALPAEGIQAPPVLFDTAEVYGYKSGAQGQSAEHLLGRFLQEGGGVPTSRAVVGSKVFPVPWTNLLVGGGVRLGREALVSALLLLSDEALDLEIERNYKESSTQVMATNYCSSGFGLVCPSTHPCNPKPLLLLEGVCTV